MARRARWSIPPRELMNGVKSDIRRVALGAVLETFTRLIIRSPVGDPGTWKRKPPPGYVGGAFRGNWMISFVGDEPQGYDINNKDSNGSATIAAGYGHSSAFKLGDTIMIRNNLPYAVPLEYGWSNQAPAGMVRITKGEFPQIVQSVDAGMAQRGG